VFSLKYNTIIIGAGVIGTSTAFHLKQQNPKQEVLVIENNDKVARGNTSKSAALYRNLFSSETSRILSSSSIAFYESIAEKIALKNLGYYWMFSLKDWYTAKAGFDRLDHKRDQFEILALDQLSNNLHINYQKSDPFNDIYRIVFGRRCGSLSAMNLANYYANEFLKLGGKIRFDTEITAVNLSHKEQCYPPWEDIKATSITDSHSTNYHADNYIFATGAWSNSLLSPIGIASQIYPKRRQMFLVKLSDSKQIASDVNVKLPVIILPTGGVYVKPVLQSNLLMVGCAADLGYPFEMEKYPPGAEESFFRNVIEPVLLHYFPKLANYQLFSKWAGYYAYYWPDKNPIIEKVSNIQWVSGTSGSGIMKADAIGRIAAARTLDKETVELFDGTEFNVFDLSLKKRKVDQEQLII